MTSGNFDRCQLRLYATARCPCRKKTQGVPNVLILLEPLEELRAAGYYQYDPRVLEQTFLSRYLTFLQVVGKALTGNVFDSPSQDNIALVVARCTSHLSTSPRPAVSISG